MEERENDMYEKKKEDCGCSCLTCEICGVHVNFSGREACPHPEDHNWDNPENFMAPDNVEVLCISCQVSDWQEKED